MWSIRSGALELRAYQLVKRWKVRFEVRVFRLQNHHGCAMGLVTAASGAAGNGVQGVETVRRRPAPLQIHHLSFAEKAVTAICVQTIS
eukprot:SAG25_NODE_4435_length_815_cov_4.328228_2_plen_88_part_00